MSYKTAILSCGFLAGLSVSLAVGVIARQWTAEAPAGIASPAVSGDPGVRIINNERLDPPGERLEQDRALPGVPHARYASTGFRLGSDSAGEACDYAGASLKITERKQSEEERERFRQLEADLADSSRSGMMRELVFAMARETMQPTPDSITAVDPGSAMACP